MAGMQAYDPPPENMFQALFADGPSVPSYEEILPRVIHRQWIDLHAVARDNLLKFENPEFRLPRMATGEQNVRTLVCFICWPYLFSAEGHVQLGQLNDIIWSSEVDWPLRTVEFNSLRGHRMDGIFEVCDNALTVNHGY